MLLLCFLVVGIALWLLRPALGCLAGIGGTGTAASAATRAWRQSRGRRTDS